MIDLHRNTYAMSLLIVDDDPSAIRLLRHILAQFQDVRFATNGEDAFRLIQERPPDLILLDEEMPGERGFEFCRRVKSHEAFRELPIIFVTSHENLAFEIRALEAGAADFITKPVSAPRVRLRIELHLKLVQRLMQVRQLAVTDSLTGLANRRAIDETLAQEWERARRSGAPLSLIMADVDLFKDFNDRFGHQAGDACLQAVATAMRETLRRATDCAGRYGGEEFVIILPDTSPAGAIRVADRLRVAVSEKPIPNNTSGDDAHVTMSLGVSCWECSRNIERRHLPNTIFPERLALMQTADRALYAAKRRGRNCVEYFPLLPANIKVIEA